MPAAARFAGWALCLALLASSAARAEAPPAIVDAVRLYEAMDDARASAALQKILLGNPPGEVAAKAHLYLGLIAFQAFHPDQARAEFRKAIEANPAIDLPPNASPKVRIAFGEARQAVARQFEAPDLAPAPPRARVANHDGLIDAGLGSPAEAKAAAPAPPGGGIPAGTWWLGGFGLAALGTGTALGVIGNGTTSQDSYPKTPYHTIPLSSAQTAANEALTADILFCAGGALVIGAIIWALTGSGSAPPSSSSPVAVAF